MASTHISMLQKWKQKNAMKIILILAGLNVQHKTGSTFQNKRLNVNVRKFKKKGYDHNYYSVDF